MKRENREKPSEEWVCGKCGAPLEQQTVGITYLQSTFSVTLPMCRQCGMVYVSENLAVVRMAEAEKVLEDK